MNKIEFFTSLTDDNDNIAKTLFSDAFMEKAENTDRLFKTLLKGSLYLYLTVNNERVCQLFLIESEVVLDKPYPIYYLYAASTDKAYRGQGLMHLLLDYAKKEVIKNGKYGIVLKPANEGLFKFYASCGFNKVLYSDIYEYEKTDDCAKINCITAKEYIDIREELLKNTPHVILKPCLEDGLNNHYHIFGNENSICLMERYTEDGKAFIAEHLGTNDSLNFALNKFNCKTATVKTLGKNNAFSVIWLNKITEPQYNIYHGPCFE